MTTSTIHTSPKITMQLFDALAVLALSDSTRAVIEMRDPKAFKQMVDALKAADPDFGERLADARDATRLRREKKALMRQDGAHILIDGVPLCRVPYLNLNPNTASSVYAPCWQPTVERVVASVESLRVLNPDLKITYQLGECPRDED